MTDSNPYVCVVIEYSISAISHSDLMAQLHHGPQSCIAFKELTFRHRDLKYSKATCLVSHPFFVLKLEVFINVTRSSQTREHGELNFSQLLCRSWTAWCSQVTSTGGVNGDHSHSITAPQTDTLDRRAPASPSACQSSFDNRNRPTAPRPWRHSANKLHGFFQLIQVQLLSTATPVCANVPLS